MRRPSFVLRMALVLSLAACAHAGRAPEGMKWIGLTGGIATGKSTVGQILRDLGYPVLDADALSREAVAPGTEGYRRVLEAFGSGVLRADGTIDRRALAGIVFSDPAARRRLEQIVVPLVMAKARSLRRGFAASGARAAFFEAATLFEQRLEDEFDAVVVVSCDPALQRRRLAARNRLSPADVEARIQSQMPMEEKEVRADYVIDNNGSVDELRGNIEKFLFRLGLR